MPESEHDDAGIIGKLISSSISSVRCQFNNENTQIICNDHTATITHIVYCHTAARLNPATITTSTTPFTVSRPGATKNKLKYFVISSLYKRSYAVEEPERLLIFMNK